MLAPVFPNRTSPHLMRGQFCIAFNLFTNATQRQSRRIAFATGVGAKNMQHARPIKSRFVRLKN